jgi:hypothetical protein
LHVPADEAHGNRDNAGKGKNIVEENNLVTDIVRIFELWKKLDRTQHDDKHFANPFLQHPVSSAIIIFVMWVVYVKLVLRQLNQEQHWNFTYIKRLRVLLFNQLNPEYFGCQTLALRGTTNINLL